jgi:hypothetical protein
MPRLFVRPLRFALAALLAGICTLAPACVHQGETPISTTLSHNLILKDTVGNVVLAADFDWPGGALTPGRNFTGQWHPVWMSSAVRGFFTFTPDNSAKYHAEIASQNMSVDLTFGNADTNVFLLGTEANGAFTGQWSRTTLTGSQVLGNFTLRTGP